MFGKRIEDWAWKVSNQSSLERYKIKRGHERERERVCVCERERGRVISFNALNKIYITKMGLLWKC